MFIIALLGKGVFRFIQKPFGIILVEAWPLLRNAVEPQIQACNEGILLLSDVFLALAAPELIQQLVIIKRCLDLKLDRCKHIRFKRVLPRIMGSTMLIAPTY